MTNRSYIIAPDHSVFCVGQCRKGDGSGGGTIFDAILRMGKKRECARSCCACARYVAVFGEGGWALAVQAAYLERNCAVELPLAKNYVNKMISAGESG